MGPEFKDYYKILGVERSVGNDDLRKAFRQLARKYHPDVAKNKKEAEEKFKEINEAYEVLSDPEKRRTYDQLGPYWKQGPQFRQSPGWQEFSGGKAGRAGRPGPGGNGGGAEFEFGGTGFSDFFEQLFGQRANRRRSGGDSGRGGFRSAPEDLAEAGRDIEGDIMVTLEEALRGSVRSVSLRRAAACDQCGGTGQSGRKPCAACHGEGVVSRTETHQVKIPPGITDGARLRIGGKGEAGVGGGPPGDLFLTVQLAGHPDFRVEGANLYYDLELAPWEAVLGASVSVPTLEGSVNIRIPPGTQTGQQLRVRGRGLGRESDRGDLHVLIRVQVPKDITDAERRLWEQLAKDSNFRPRE